MEGQTQDSEATPHLPRHPRQYQAEVREASIDELAHDDLYGGGNQPRHVTLSSEGEEAKDAENSQWIADYFTEEPIDFAQELQSTSAGHQQPSITRNDGRSGRNYRRPSRPQPQNTSRVEPGTNSSRKELALRFELPRRVSTPEESESSIITEDFSESESWSLSSEEDTPPRDPPLLQPNRYAMHPVDIEGNRLSFQVQTKPSSSSIALSEESDKPENKEGPGAEKKEPGDKNLEIRRITRAMAIESDAQNMLEIHTLPSLASPRLRTSIATTWYHLNGSHLDFDRFENVCLTIPHLSDRLQALTREVLLKLRGEKIKPFVGGRFIEPGTVLRADESDPTDTQSVIFSCVPYFNLQQVAKPTTGQGDSRFHPRTLMQALYPYESVRERDEEQSYRRFGNDPMNNIVHVPSLWIINIGSTAIVTYGHETLPIAMKSSIGIVEEDIRLLGRQSITENTLTKVHITNRDGSSLIYPLGDFRSYFQLESRILHSNPSLEGPLVGEGINLKVEDVDGGTMAGARNWKSIVSRAAQLVSITITIPYDQIRDGRDEEASTALPAAVGPPTCVPPFFHWLQSKTNDLSHRGGKPVVLGTTGKDRSIACLDYVEKLMTSRSLVRSTSPVEDAFTSTNYYHSLPETVCEGVSTRRSELHELVKATPLPESGSINHKMIVTTHCSKILTRSVEFLDTVCKTLGLFVDDLDSSSMLRKLSGAMQNIHQQVTTIAQRGAVEPDPEEYTNSDWKHPDMLNNRIWSIRTSAWEVPSSLPESRKTLQRSIQRCARCRRPFSSAASAMKHLVRHVEKYSAGTAHPDAEIPSFEELQDWIINSVQYRRELTNASALVILTHASEIAKDFLVRAKELAEGVQNEDGQLSSLYTLPQELIHAFQKIVIYYLAIERALHENEKTYGLDPRFQDSRKLTNGPYSSRDVEVLRRFGFQARRSLRKARFLFCDMGRPELPLNLRKHLSLGPEYVSLWFMRGLLMKPLEQSKTIGDMYHVYVSKVQFEINHRPSKRLLRAINLIQEELQVLQLVNTWQTNLVRNYLKVIDDNTYEKLSPSRRAMHPYEKALGRACLDHLSLVRLDYIDLMRRCAPLSDRTKQILEINEEDHGKAIMVFTVVTVIFLPLSFVTSYFGMNASDIRDMDETQAVFWSVAIPLTCVTVGSCLLIGYNGDSIRDLLSSMYRKTMRKESDIVEAASITVAQRQGPSKSKGGLDSIIDPFGAAYDAFPGQRRDLYRESYGDDDFDEWYVRDHPRLLDQHSKSAHLPRPSPCGFASKRKNSYPTPAHLAIEARRQSLYSDPHVLYRRSSRNDYEESPYLTPNIHVVRDHPRRTGTTKSRYTNSTNTFSLGDPVDGFSPYADDAYRRRLAEFVAPPPPPRRRPNDGISRSRSEFLRYSDDDEDDWIKRPNATPTRRRSEFLDYSDDDDDEWYTSTRGDVNLRTRHVRHGRSRSGSWGYSRSRSQSRDRFYERAPVRRVHYADEPVESFRHRMPSGDSFSYRASEVPGHPRRGGGQEYEAMEEELERQEENIERRQEEKLKRHRYR